MNKIGLFLLAGVLTACGSSVIVPDTVDASGDSNSPSQVVSGDLTTQQITYCYGSSMQNVHKGLYQEPANSGIYPIKAKSNFICTRELLNLNVYVRLVVLKLSGSNWIEVGAAENQGRVGTDGLNLFTQVNVPCINGTYKSKLYDKDDFRFWWQPVLQGGESAISTVTGC